MDQSGRISRIVGVPRLTDPPTGATQSVSVEVVRVLGPGRFLINFSGRSATAFSSLDLQPGQWLKADLSQDADGLVIRVPIESKGDSIASILRDFAIADDVVSRRIVEALLRTGIGLNPDRIAYLRTLFKAYSASGRLRGLTRLAALLEDKGLDASLSEALFEPVYGNAEHNDSEAREDAGEGEGRQGASRGALGGHAQPVDHEKLIQHISGQLRSLLRPGGGLGAPADPGKLALPEGPGADLLRLFNHVPGTAAHWVVVPFRLRRGESAEPLTDLPGVTELAGRIRLRLDTTRVVGATAGAGTDLVVLDVEGSKGRWWCEIRPNRSNGKYKVMLSSSSDTAATAARDSLGEFEARFSDAGISIDKLVCSQEFDGFSSESTMDIIQDIDMKA